MPVLVALLVAGALFFGGVTPSAARGPADANPETPSRPAESRETFVEYWVAAHAATSFWTDPVEPAWLIGTAHQWAVLKVLGPQQGGRLHVWSPGLELVGWVDAGDVGPIDPRLAGTRHLPPIGARILWGGQALVTMYTCVELGGCAPTASGIWPEPGVVAVDPTVIPLGSKVWVEGLGVFLAADTGSLVKGAHLDVFSTSYSTAIQWGIRSLAVVVFE